jgi:erythromycin esterase-like protein
MYRTARFLVLLTLTLLILPAAAAAAVTGGGDGNAQTIAPGVYRIDGFDPSLPLGDLEPLRRIVGDARVVGLGESVHTSGGFYQLKHRIFRFLVEEMGFRVFGFETPWFNAEPAAAYVETCPSEMPAAVIDGLSRPWRSTEVRDILQWMCEWNRSHPNPSDRLHFYGFDNQRQAQGNGEALIAYLEKTGFAADHPWIQGIQACDGVVDTFWPSLPFPAERYEQCQAALLGVASYFDGNEKALTHQTSREELAWARIHLVGQRAWQEQLFFATSDFLRSYSARERGMAYVAQEIRRLRFPNERVAIWGHNGHVMHDAIPYVGIPGMGNYLSEELGRAYTAVALTASEVYVDWVPAGYCGLKGGLTVPGELQVEDVLRSLGEEALLVDLDPRGDDRSHPAFLQPGAVYGLADGAFVPAVGFDALFYLKTTPAMHPLAWAPCQP